MSTLPANNPLRKASTFTVKAGRMLTRHWLRLWKIRNEQHQTKNDPDVVTAHEDQIRNRIRAFYLLRPRMRPYDTRIFYPTVEEHLLDSLPDLESWIIVTSALSPITCVDGRVPALDLTGFFSPLVVSLPI
jgi:hypothetical protein